METKKPRGRPRKNPDAPVVKRPPGRPRKVLPAIPVPQQPAEDMPGGEESLGPPSMDIADIYGGVTASWLAQMFGHDKNTIKKKLSAANLEVVGQNRGAPTYRLHEAAQYLVKPKVDLVAYVKSLRPNDLPPMLNEAYWSAMLKRQKWEENARDLWRTSDVLEVFGDLAISFKTTVNLWVEEVDRQESLSPEQRKIITTLCDKLLEQLHEQMIESPKKRKTVSSVFEDGAMPEGGLEDET